MAYKEPIGEIILKKALGNAGADPDAARNKTVLSCGGIYIPHNSKNRRTIHQLVNTHSKDNPVKVMISSEPKNVLYKLLIKESLN